MIKPRKIQMIFRGFSCGVKNAGEEWWGHAFSEIRGGNAASLSHTVCCPRAAVNEALSAIRPV
jgi:hypothetical protein